MTRPRRPAVWLGALVVLVASACGTRLPDSAFRNASTEKDGSVAAGKQTSAAARSSSGDAASGDTTTGGTTGATGSGDTATGDTGSGGTAGATAGPADAAPSGGGQASTAAGATGGGTKTASPVNTASDVGITESEIRVGNITAVGGPLGPEAFSGMLHGAQAFFQALNERGGVNGRKVKFSTCDDRESSDRDNACAQSLIENQKVFALVAGATDTYASAKYIDSKGVPDVGGQPIGNAYYKYPHLFSILGADVPRNGKDIGDKGKLYAQSGAYRYFKQQVNVNKAAVFFYVIPISKTAGMFIADGLRRENIDVVYYGGGSEAGINPAAPSYDTDVIQMRNKGVEGIWNSIDIAGFQKLCQAMDRYSFRVKANVSTIQGMSDKVGQDFSSPCRNDVWAQTSSKSYNETSAAPVAEFRNAMKKFDPGFRLHQWALEGWAASKLLTNGIATMGASPTRKGLVDWLNAQNDYTIDGLMDDPVDWKPLDHSKPARDCFDLHQWQDSAKGWVTRTKQCPVMPWYPYTPYDDGA